MSTQSWYRRVVPEGYATSVLRLVGTSPLLMSNGEGDRDSPLYRAYFLLGQKKSKSLDDQARLREMEWQLRIYLDDELGPYIPGRNLKELLRSAATKWRKGEEIKRSLLVIASRVPLIYEGPRDQQKLWDAGFRHMAMARNSGPNAGSVLRCRPMFPEWAVEAELAFDPEDIDPDLLSLIVERSQRYGLGDYRPEYGAFDASLDAVSTLKDGAKGKATKDRNGSEEKAHDAFKARIMVKS